MIKAIITIVSLCFTICAGATKQHQTAEQLAGSLKRAKSFLATNKDRHALTDHTLKLPQGASESATAQSESSNNYDFFVTYNFAGATCSEDTAYQATAQHLNTCVDVTPADGVSSIMYVCNDQGFGVVGYPEAGCQGTSTPFALEVATADMNTCVVGDISWGDDDVDDEGDDDDDDDITQMSWAACTNQLDFGFANAAAIGIYLDANCSNLFVSAHYVVDKCLSGTNDSAYYTCDDNAYNETYYDTSAPSCVDSDEVASFSTVTNVCQSGDFSGDDDDFISLNSVYAACDAQSLPDSFPAPPPTDDDDGAVMPSHLATLLLWIPIVLFASAIIQ